MNYLEIIGLVLIGVPLVIAFIIYQSFRGINKETYYDEWENYEKKEKI